MAKTLFLLCFNFPKRSSIRIRHSAAKTSAKAISPSSFPPAALAQVTERRKRSAPISTICLRTICSRSRAGRDQRSVGVSYIGVYKRWRSSRWRSRAERPRHAASTAPAPAPASNRHAVRPSHRHRRAPPRRAAAAAAARAASRRGASARAAIGHAVRRTARARGCGEWPSEPGPREAGEGPLGPTPPPLQHVTLTLPGTGVAKKSRNAARGEPSNT